MNQNKKKDEPQDEKPRPVCHHQHGTVVTYFTAAGDIDYTVTCYKCRAAWIYGTQPAKMELFDVLGKAWKR